MNKPDNIMGINTSPSSRELVVVDKRKLTDTLKQWLPRNCHELLYGTLTVICAVEALRTGSVPIQLIGSLDSGSRPDWRPNGKQCLHSHCGTHRRTKGQHKAETENCHQRQNHRQRAVRSALPSSSFGFPTQFHHSLSFLRNKLTRAIISFSCIFSTRNSFGLSSGNSIQAKQGYVAFSRDFTDTSLWKYFLRKMMLLSRKCSRMKGEFGYLSKGAWR